MRVIIHEEQPRWADERYLRGRRHGVAIYTKVSEHFYLKEVYTFEFELNDKGEKVKCHWSMDRKAWRDEDGALNNVLVVESEHVDERFNVLCKYGGFRDVTEEQVRELYDKIRAEYEAQGIKSVIGGIKVAWNE